MLLLCQKNYNAVMPLKQTAYCSIWKFKRLSFDLKFNRLCSIWVDETCTLLILESFSVFVVAYFYQEVHSSLQVEEFYMCEIFIS
ncbi:MAG: hypothetical protein AUK44_05765 [Porphyromonadaceae bacterium CG2_30_38_12]|nr:MAG: hypothetical protein AUK44_05765 [Porphyromonadaceae bacterium CG2_30_38_12]